MDSILQFLAVFVNFIESSKYVLLFMSSYLEGSAIIIFSGFLLHEGQVSFWPAFLALYAGDMLSDITLYLIGYWGARSAVNRFGRFIGITNDMIDKVEGYFMRYHIWILIISKLTMGFGFAYATLITAGIMRVPLPRFIIINGLGGIIWLSFLMSLGYFFGITFQNIPSNLKYVILAVLFIIMMYAVKYIHKKMKSL